MANEWIADATRRLAVQAESDSDAPAADSGAPVSGWSGEAMERLRSAIAQQVSGLPRRSRPVATTTPGATITQLALTRALTFALSAEAAAESAAIADVEFAFDGAAVTAVHIHLVAVGAERRPQTMLAGGDRLRDRAAGLLAGIVGPVEVRVDLTWEDLVTRDEH
ncbi:hypothetical protein [Tsukamurella paurometabola]|uniref:hypothetical protein n=1 Tax=Tsukamurella paurometabola TaxID=2061 RepID=UPI00019EDC77|nr:hypothetical protein [Tsukamurella paurometabola]